VGDCIVEHRATLPAARDSFANNLLGENGIRQEGCQSDSTGGLSEWSDYSTTDIHPSHEI